MPHCSRGWWIRVASLLLAGGAGACWAPWQAIGGVHRCFLTGKESPWGDAARDANCSLAVIESEAEAAAWSTSAPDGSEVWVALQLHRPSMSGGTLRPGTPWKIVWRVGESDYRPSPPNTPVYLPLLTQIQGWPVSGDSQTYCVTLSKSASLQDGGDDASNGTSSHDTPFFFRIRECAMRFPSLCIRPAHDFFIKDASFSDTVISGSGGLQRAITDIESGVSLVSFSFSAAEPLRSPDGGGTHAIEADLRDFGRITHILNGTGPDVSSQEYPAVGEPSAPDLLVNESYVVLMQSQYITIYFADSGLARPGAWNSTAMFPFIVVQWGANILKVSNADWTRAHHYAFQRGGKYMRVWVDGVKVVETERRGDPLDTVGATGGAQSLYKLTPGGGVIRNFTIHSREAENFTGTHLAEMAHDTAFSLEDAGDSVTCYFALQKHAFTDGPAMPLWVSQEDLQREGCRLWCLRDTYCVGIAWDVTRGVCKMFTTYRGEQSVSFSDSPDAGDSACWVKRIPTAVFGISYSVDVPIPAATAQDALPFFCANFSHQALEPSSCKGRSYTDIDNTTKECYGVSDSYVTCIKVSPRPSTSAGCGAFNKVHDWYPLETDWLPHPRCPMDTWWLQYAPEQQGKPLRELRIVAPPKQPAQRYAVFACSSQSEDDTAAGAARPKSLSEQVSESIRCVRVATCGHQYNPEAVMYRKAECRIDAVVQILRVQVIGYEGSAVPAVHDLELDFEEDVVPDTPTPVDHARTVPTPPAAKIIAIVLGPMIAVMFLTGLIGNIAKSRLCRASAVKSEEGPTIPQGRAVGLGVDVTMLASPPNEIGGGNARCVVAVADEDALPPDHRMFPSSRIQSRDLRADSPTDSRRWRGPGAARNVTRDASGGDGGPSGVSPDGTPITQELNVASQPGPEQPQESGA